MTTLYKVDVLHSFPVVDAEIDGLQTSGRVFLSPGVHTVKAESFDAHAIENSGYIEILEIDGGQHVWGACCSH